MSVQDDLDELRKVTHSGHHGKINRVEDEIARLEERANFADAYKYRERAEAAEAEVARLKDGLRVIASRTYPATYLGEAKDGTKMYGGTYGAAQFALEVLDESDAT